MAAGGYGGGGAPARAPREFPPVRVRVATGIPSSIGPLRKRDRLKRYGRKRLVIVHEHAELTDMPRFFLTDAQHWESGRVIETWSYRWASDIFHEFGKQVTGLEGRLRCARRKRSHATSA